MPHSIWPISIASWPARGELAALTVTERFYEIGSVAGIEATERYLTGRGGR